MDCCDIAVDLLPAHPVGHCGQRDRHGIPLAGWVFDKWVTHQWIWFAFAGLSVAALVIVLTIPPVQNKTQLADKLRARQDTF